MKDLNLTLNYVAGLRNTALILQCLNVFTVVFGRFLSAILQFDSLKPGRYCHSLNAYV